MQAGSELSGGLDAHGLISGRECNWQFVVIDQLGFRWVDECQVIPSLIVVQQSSLFGTECNQLIDQYSALCNDHLLNPFWIG